MCELAHQMKIALENNELSNFGEILNEGWMKKKELASGIANSQINEMYDRALSLGASGGKLLGAGGGGFLLFYCDKDKQENLINGMGLRQFPVRFEHDGTSVVYIGDKYW